MPIFIMCSCGKRLQAAETAVGKLVACPACKAHHRVPAPEPPPMAIIEEPLPTPPPLPRALPPPLPPPLPPEFEEAAVELRAPYDAEDDEDPVAENFGPPGGELDFFQPPPKRIGTVRSAHTSLLRHQRATTMGTRLIYSAVITLVAVVVLVIVLFATEVTRRMDRFDVCMTFAGTVIFFLLVFGISLVATQFSHFCGYVGTHGLAYTECSGSRRKITKKQSFSFDEAADLRTKLVHHYVNGVYQNTQYEFHWTDEEDAVLMSVTGSHTAHNAMPPDSSSYIFAVVAENHWSAYVTAKVLDTLESGGSYTFYLTGGGTLKLRSDMLRLRIGRNDQDFYPEDIAEMVISEGVIQLKEPGAKQGWFTSTGIHRFNFADLSNARVFLLLMEKLFDVPIR